MEMEYKAKILLDLFKLAALNESLKPKKGGRQSVALNKKFS